MQEAVGSIKYRFDFLKYRYLWLAISVIYFIVGIAAYVVRGGFNYHIDFTGGAEIRVSFQSPVPIGRVRDAINKGGWSDSVIQSIGTSQKEFIIRVADMDENTEPAIKKALASSITDSPVHIDNVEWVGAEAGKDTVRRAALAIMLCLVILLIYIAIRFEFRFGIGAVACLLHDILAVIVFLLISGEAVSLHVLASLVAVLGYSINDTIVVFSKIRENFKKYKGVSEYDLANLSINQTLRRTILTSAATTLSVLAILFLGGETLRGLALVMLVGIIVGTYSSIYIASPTMLAIKRKRLFGNI